MGGVFCLLGMLCGGNGGSIGYVGRNSSEGVSLADLMVESIHFGSDRWIFRVQGSIVVWGMVEGG